MIISVIRFLNIIVAALLAGISVGIWIGFNPLDLSPSTYIEQQQNTIRSLNVLMISLVVFATVITIISAFLQKGNKEDLIVLLFASLFFISCILISRFGNQPINKIIMTWTTDSLPANLSELRDKWWSFHIMRTIAELIALFLVTWISIKSIDRVKRYSYC
jgi:ABC-type proline/glycine betaine transport system permease subunit